MKKLIALSLLVLLILSLFFASGCETPAKYVFSMVHPVESSSNIYEDEYQKLQFVSVTNQIQFTIKNKSESPIKILWDNCVFTGLDGTTSRIIHWGVKYIDADKSIPPTIIPPGVEIEDGIVPSKNVRWGYKSWVVDNIIPYFTEVDGQTFSLYFCTEINGKETYVNFKFVITKVSPENVASSNKGMQIQLSDKLPNASYKQGFLIGN